MPKIYLPTPLRPYAEGAATVQVPGGTIAEALERSCPGTRPYATICSMDREGSGPSSTCTETMRTSAISFTKEDDRSDGDTLSIIPSIAGGSPVPRSRRRGAYERGDPALRAPPDHAGGRAGGAEEAEGRPRAGRRRGRARLAAALYLAAAGVGTIGLVDFDVVDESNLQRQILHGDRATSGGPSSHAAAERLARCQPARARRAVRGRG